MKLTTPFAGTGAIALAVVLGAAAPAFAQDEQITIGMSQPNIEHPYRVSGIQRAQAWAEQQPNVALEIIDGRRDSALQLQAVEDLLLRDIDALVMSPNDSDALAPVAAAAERADVPLVIFDRALNVDPSQYASYIGGDNVEMGRVAAHYIAEQIGGEGKVIQLEGTPGASATTDRKAGFEEVMAEEYPDIEVVSYVGHFRLHEAVSAMEDAVTAHRDLDAVYGHNDSMAVGAAQVLRESGIDDAVIVGIDGGQEGCDAVRQGVIDASVYYPTMMPEALEIAMQVINGEEVEKQILLDTPLITSETVDDICG